MILCQVCHTPNTLGSEFCKQCGTKLLVLGGNQQWEEYAEQPFSLEDHFLERISNLEDTVSNILDHLTRFAENLDGIDRNGFITRSGLTALVDTLVETHDLKESMLRDRWETTITEQMEEGQIRDRFAQLKNRFLALYRGEPEKKKNFESVIDDAEFQIFSGNIEHFMDHLEIGLDLDPLNYELAYFLGELSFEIQRGDQEHFLKLALDSNPEHSDSLLMLAVYYYAQDQLEKSEELLARALSVNPRDEAALLCLGSILTTREEFATARPILEKSIEIKSQAQAFYLLGIGYKEEGQQNKAISNLEKAIDIDPEMEDAYYMLGFAYLQRGWNRKAKTAFSEALLLNPLKVEYQEALSFEQPKADMDLNKLDTSCIELFKEAEQLFKQKKFKAAITKYRKLVKKTPDNPVFLCSLAVAQFSLQRWEDVIKVARKLRKLETPEIFSCIAYTLQMESERSLERFDDALLTLSGMQSSMLGEYGQAIAACGIALTLADMGEELETAEKIVVNVLEFTPEELKANLLDALGWVFFKQGKLEESLTHLEKALALDENVITLQHYGLALLSVNLQDKALDVFAKLLELRGQEPKVDQFIFRALERESMQLKPPKHEEQARFEK